MLTFAEKLQVFARLTLTQLNCQERVEKTEGEERVTAKKVSANLNSKRMVSNLSKRCWKF